MKLSLLPNRGGPFANMPAQEVDLNEKDIYCNDVVLPEEFNPNHVHLFVVLHQFGPIAAIWAAEHELLDVAVDLGVMDCFALDEADCAKHDHNEANAYECENCEGCARLGNASEPFNLDDCHVQQVDLDPSKHWKLLIAFAEARGAGRDTLWS